MKLRHECYSLYLLLILTNTYLRYLSRYNIIYIFIYKAETYLSRLAANRFQEVMSPRNSNSTMSAFSTNNSDTMTLVVPKLCNDGSNWANYEPRIQRALGLKGLWRHVEGTAIVPKPYVLVARVPFSQMERPKLWKTRLRLERRKSSTMTSANTSLSMSFSLWPLLVSATRSKTLRLHMICGMR